MAAPQVKKGTFTANTATGNQAVSGIGFQPKAIILWTTGQTATGYGAGNGLGLGFGVSSSQRRTMGIFDDDNAATSNAGRQTQAAQVLHFLNTGSPGTAGQADLVSLDADGFTVNWATTVPPAAIIHYIALGGAGLTNAFVGGFLTATSTGNLAVTGVGFQPDLVLFMGVGNGTGGNLDAKLGIGVARSSSERAACFVGAEDAVAPAKTNCSYQVSDKCIVLPDNSAANTVDFEADFVSMDSDGFTINRTNAAGTTANIFFLALKGGSYKVGTETQTTAPGTKATSGLGLQPSGLLVFGVNQAASASLNTSACKLSLGASDGTNEGCTWGESVDGVDPSNTNRRNVTDKILTHSASDTTTSAEADLSSFDSDGFTLDWTTADGTARQFIYVAIGGPPAAVAKKPLVLLRSQAVARGATW